MTAELSFGLAAFAALLGVVLLGVFVSSRTPTRLDVEAVALRGVAIPLAAAFTLLGRWYSLTAILAGAFCIVLAMRADPWPLAMVAVSQAGSQVMSMLFKSVFHRVRPDHWLLWQEPDRSYPSGHSTTAFAFYLPLFVLVMHSHAVPPGMSTVALALLSACVAGLPWSRLALGAHYLSDVVGGMLLGSAWFFALLAFGASRGLGA